MSPTAWSPTTKQPDPYVHSLGPSAIARGARSPLTPACPDTHDGATSPAPRRAAPIQMRGDDVAAKFEIYKDSRGEYRFRLKAGNGETVATGESYPTKDGVKRGIDAVKRAAAAAEIVDTTD